MRLSARISILAILAFAPLAQAQAPGQANGIPSPIEKVSPTGAVSIPQAEIPSVGTLDPVQPHWVVVNPGNGQAGSRSVGGDPGKMRCVVMILAEASFVFDPLAKNFYVGHPLWSKRDPGTREDNLLA